MIHHAAQAFDQVADAYENGRPSYPTEAVAHLTRLFNISSSSTVVDLAAGTGKFTQILVSTGARIIAVEPLEGMRARLEAHNLGVEIVSGSAEAIPLADAAVDLVTIAQAFHWFANESALAEIHRVLRPGGGLALIWNRRDTTQPVQQALQALMEPHRGDVPKHRDAEWRAVFDGTDLFTPLEEWSTLYGQEVDVAGLVDRVLSVSFMAALPPADRTGVERQIRDLARDLPDPLTLRYTTDVYGCRAR